MYYHILDENHDKTDKLIISNDKLKTVSIVSNVKIKTVYQCPYSVRVMKN